MKNTYVALMLGTALAVGASQASAACANTLTLADFTWVGAPTHIFTAAVVNPKGTLNGDVDATGCDIGVYYGPAAATAGPSTAVSAVGMAGGGGTVNGVSVHGATYFGLVNNGANVNIFNSTFYDIGDNPLTGNQYGIGVYFNFKSNARGDIKYNTIWNYQLAGIVVSGPKANGDVSTNTVIGSGPTNVIVQTGIQLGYGAESNALNNLVVGNSYTGTQVEAGTGILIVGGPCMGGQLQTGSNILTNVGVGNDIGIWMVNLDKSCNPTTTPTNNLAQHNTLRNNTVNNTELGGYQAGITDEGDHDSILDNSICGKGYTPIALPPPFLYAVDTTFTNDVTVKDIDTCDATGPITKVTTQAPIAAAHSAPLRPVVIQ